MTDLKFKIKFYLKFEFQLIVVFPTLSLNRCQVTFDDRVDAYRRNIARALRSTEKKEVASLTFIKF